MSKKSRVNFMPEDTFWGLIDESLSKTSTSEEQIEYLQKQMLSLEEEAIIGFHYQFDKVYFNSYTSELWATAYVACGGCSDDGFDYFRCWVISRGKDVYNNALKNPDSLVTEFDKLSDDDFPELEDMLSLADDAISQKTGKDFYDIIDNYEDDLNGYPSMKFNWEEDNEESMKKICPKVFEKYWENPF
ncbi:MAG: DUF4240 domain-containing protein [bacterium]|nr:DUF4240 domain-containing protein [bacterium]